MGLDMYLTKKTYVKNWDYMEAAKRHSVTVTGPSASKIRPERISYIEEEVAYWRKANAIHQWFVRHCQDGVDDCRQAYVSCPHLRALATLCTELTDLYATDPMAAETRAAHELPPQPGFFFGSIAFDEDYWETVRETGALLTSLLNDESDDGSLYYQSSW